MAVPEAKCPPPSSDLSAAVGGVRRGRELAAQLVALLRRESGQHAVEDEAGGLAEQVLASFSTALSALDASGESSGLASPPRFDHGGSEGETGRRRFRPAGERRRGQTRRSQPYGWTRVETTTLEDGYTWRKYGQKEIRDAKYPRCYFRCTHKHAQGCQAARQVQKSEQDPSMFLITYLGQHTCKQPAAPLRPDAAEPFVITFGSPVPALAGGPRLPPPQPFPQAEQETEDDALSRNGSSSPEYLMLPELTPLDASEPASGRGISTVAPDVAGDVTSGFLGVDFIGKSFQFDDMLGLEHDDFTFVFY
ncbi:hypothetical protein Taro_019623 [Colocasia esculenta]|uniref:WRKY domain-containing protein n=1 Tax=Colocasia esculenta TaxID=4460 RepID=A0A843UZX5_COLES|nr:hypothetical protein [Colocasia esculenta]